MKRDPVLLRTRSPQNACVILHQTQCESKVFFPDDPNQPPQFNGCTRLAVTTRRTWRFGDRAKGEPNVLNKVVKLCERCAQAWDDGEWERKGL